MKRFDERRPRFWRKGRGFDRDEAYRDDNYRFERGEESGRTPGRAEQQPFSRNPYGYYPGQPGQDARRPAPRYGQREPYDARGGYRGERRGDRRNEQGSRYSESQYGMGRGRFDPYGDRHEPEFGEGAFADTSEPPSYFGAGDYGDGGTSYTGGFDQRWRRRNLGSLGEDTFSQDHSPRRDRRYRAGPKGYTRSDDRIREDICERLMLADSIDSSEVSVTVKEGKVMLEGTVPTRSMKHEIEDLADYTGGVQDVENRLRVERQRWEDGNTSAEATSSATQTASGATPTGTLGSRNTRRR